MDAARYFEMMHRAMSAWKRDTTLLLRVKVQDLGGADAYLELRQEPGSARVRVFYSTMGRRNLNFQLFRKGWQLCHNASGEMTGRFPARADELLSADDFAAYIRDDALDAGRAERVLHELRRCSGDHTAALPRNAREGALITVDSFVGRGAHWCYWSTDAAVQLPWPPSSAGWAISWPGRSGAPSNPARRPSSWPLSGRPTLLRPLPARWTGCPSPWPPPLRLLPAALLHSLCRTPGGRASSPCWQRYKKCPENAVICSVSGQFLSFAILKIFNRSSPGPWGPASPRQNK